MPSHDSLPDLTFPAVEYGEMETPWDLRILLYKGGAGTRVNRTRGLIASGALGAPQLDRLELLCKLHEEISANLSKGGSRATADSLIQNLRSMFTFAEHRRLPLTLAGITETYLHWADFLVHRTRIKHERHASGRSKDKSPLSKNSAYSQGSAIGTILNRILGRSTLILDLTRLEPPRGRKSAIGVQAEKQNLSDTFSFGHFLQDICDGLNLRTTLETPLPINISLRSGKVLTRVGDRTARSERGARLGMDERYPLANLRVEAELMMFIAQTGMNLGPASGLKLQHFFYVGHIDGYQVKEYKARRGGAVLFEIFKEYKPHFERYLAWRRVVFPNSELLFPFFRFRGGRPDACVSLHRVWKVCKELDVPYASPRTLRNTRVNWLLRMSANPDITAELAQHTKKTLHKQYERPSLQRAIVQATHFWSKADPHLSRMEAVAPGGCAGSAHKSLQASKDVPKPDCLKGSGCFWCTSHRDVDSLDYVWGLSTFRHLKVIELSKNLLPQGDAEVPPAKLVIDRLDEKLRWFEESSELRLSWVEESRARVNEGDFHPDLRCEISEWEGTV